MRMEHAIKQTHARAIVRAAQQVVLVNAREVIHVPSRKTEVRKWTQKLHQHELLRAS